jgi:predicted enzyme related to lactoylglutathione lyase
MDAVGSYDHIDFRVRDVKRVARFYDALMPALGFSKIRKGDRSRSYYNEDPEAPFFGLIQAIKSEPSRSRVAFAAPTRSQVDRVARVVRKSGGKEISGPERCYTQPYYAVFFEDPEGNRLEVCCRR